VEYYVVHAELRGCLHRRCHHGQLNRMQLNSSSPIRIAGDWDRHTLRV
jgi:hypothetical protein